MSNPIPLESVGRITTNLTAKTDDSNSKAVQRDALGCLLGLLGLRITEIRNLTVADWRRSRPKLRIHTLKGGPSRSLPMPNHIRKILDRQTARRKYVEPLLATKKGKPISDRNLRRRWESWSVEWLGSENHYRFHDLRHTAAHVVFKAAPLGLGVFAVKLWLRHSKLENSLLYIINEQDIEEWMNQESQDDQ